ncbi:MAG: hypothetical protein H5U00_12015, partial [Clostridia bacterium]|nr:hypothetical protein [Clostridia bacterium]
EREPRIRLAPKTIKHFKDKIRQITKRNWSIELHQRLRLLNTYLKGWVGYFRLIDTPSTLKALDEWIRRRLRMCLLKQWKRPRTRRRNLTQLPHPGPGFSGFLPFACSGSLENSRGNIGKPKIVTTSG